MATEEQIEKRKNCAHKYTRTNTLAGTTWCTNCDALLDVREDD